MVRLFCLIVGVWSLFALNLLKYIQTYNPAPDSMEAGIPLNKGKLPEKFFFDALITYKPTGATAATSCIPTVTSSISAAQSGSHVCVNAIAVRYQMYNGASMNNNVTLQAGPPNNIGACINKIIFGGSYSECSRCAAGSYKLTPTSNEDPLRGVTTLDLAMISKHILNLEPLDSPYKLVAADANKSGTITTLDIVALRRIILGIDSVNNNNNSFRFIDSAFVFSNPANSFVAPFPEDIPFSLPPGVQAAFKVIKVGDVNATYMRPSGVQKAGFHPPSALPGQQVEIPVFALNKAHAIAWQMDMLYDTTAMSLTSIRWPASGSRYEQAGWHEKNKGSVRLLWYDGSGVNKALESGTPLFYARFRAKAALQQEQSSAFPLITLGQSIPSEVYLADNTVQQWGMEASQQVVMRESPLITAAESPVRQHLSVYPNPAGRHFRIDIWVAAAQAEASLLITDMTGRTVLQKHLDLPVGTTTLRSVDLPQTLPPGTYTLTLESVAGRDTKRLVVLKP